MDLIWEKVVEQKNFSFHSGNRDRILKFRDLIFIENELQGGRITQQKERVYMDDDGEHLHASIVSDHPPIWFLISKEKQILYIQANCYSRIGIAISSLCKALSSIFTNMLDSMYTVEVKRLPAKGRFWDIVKRSKGVNYVEFKFMVPNIAGRTSAEIREELNRLKIEENVTSIVERKESKLGCLRVVEDEVTKAKVDTIENTGGVWSINNNEGIFRSTDNDAKVNVSHIGEVFSSQIIHQLREELAGND
ncbi:hypothetical protein DSM101010T_17810 [Desulfovibrio subterraneus]|uniref:Uncharacterized protein n=2 Tax=Desulfovibrio subterraneus TaxID=2718620 RepID=A0A7J0BIB5_9BACT|nr:hypothetical protein DSM101010T_17810 [Desulfovibrio subterraneus]